MNRSLVVNGALLALAIATGALVWATRDAPTTAEVESRKDKLLPSFRKEAVARLRLRRDGKRLELVRSGVSGEFDITEPWAERADIATVGELLSSLELASFLRAADGATREAAGLGAGAFSVELEMAGNTTQISVGGPAPGPPGARYAELDARGVVRRVVVSRGLVSELDVPFDKFRETRLFDYGRRDLVKLAFAGKGGHFELEQREHGAFFVTREGRAELADPVALERIVSALSRISSERFVEPEQARSALTAGALTVAVTASDGPHVTLSFAESCPGAPERGLVLREQAGKAARAGCLPSDVVSALAVGADQLRLDGPFSVTADAVEELAIRGGSQRFDLARKDKAWILRAPSQSEVALEAGNERVSALVGARGERPAASEAKALGLEPAFGEAVIQIAGSDERAHREERVRVGQPRADGSICVERELDRVRLCFAAAAARAFTADASALRNPNVLSFSPAELVSLSIDTPELHERVTRTSEGGYRLESPSGFNHDGGLVADAVQALGTLRAVRWLGTSNEPSFGLATPRLRVTVELSSGAKRELSVGVATESGSYARMSPDPAIFLISPLTLADLETPLIDRSLCPFAAGELTRIELTQGKRSLSLRRNGDTWQGGDLPPARAAELAEVLSALRAEQALHVGEARPHEGFRRPRLTITFTDRRSRVAHLTLGSQGALGDQSVVFARIDTVDATFALAARTAEELEGFR